MPRIGDVLDFAEAVSRFNGHWEDGEGRALRIDSSKVFGLGDGAAELKVVSASRCSLQEGNTAREGTLSTARDRIVWSDGTAWVRVEGIAAPKPSGQEPQPLPAAAAAAPAAAAGGASARGRLSLEEVLSMQEDLRLGFSCQEFQDKLGELEARLGRASKRYSPEHTELFLTVQNKILPKYGLETGQKGVLRMLDDASLYNSNPQVRQNRDALNRLLGLEIVEIDDREDDFAKLGEARKHNLTQRIQEEPWKSQVYGATHGRTPAAKRPPLVTELLKWQPVSLQAPLLHPGGAGDSGDPDERSRH